MTNDVRVAGQRPLRPTGPVPRVDPKRSVQQRALAGTGVVVLGVATGKWGSYLGAPPLFLTDFLIGIAIAVLALGRLLNGASPPAQGSARSWPGLACLAFLGYVFARFLVGPDYSLAAVRDFAPYGYALIAFVSAYSFHQSSAADRGRTGRVLGAALLFHLGWVIVVKLVPAVVTVMPLVDPSQGLRLFSLRGSTDATVIGITAAIWLIRFLRSGSLRDLSVVAASVLAVVSTTARAALLGTAAAMVLAMWLHHCAARAGDHRRRRLLVAGLLPLSLVGAGVLLPLTAAGQKLLVGFGLTGAHTSADNSAINTARGRSEAWRLVGAYVEEEDSAILGVGFGPDFLAESGGRAPLGNGELLRSPHNYIVGTWARLGAVGVLLLILLLAVAVREMFRMRAHAADGVLGSFVVLFPVAFFISAVFGVELETPFGAIPFFWCLGIILSRPRPEPV